jgi:hypothetical protein
LTTAERSSRLMSRNILVSFLNGITST